MSLPPHVGIDFGNHSVKAVLLDDIDSENPRLVSYGAQKTPIGAVNSSDPKHQEELARTLNELFEAQNIKNDKVVMALPESAVFTRFLEIVGVHDDELQDAVYYEAKNQLPIPREDVQMSFIKIGTNEATSATRILLVAVPKKIVDIYLTIVENAGYEPLAIETESIAIGRAMYRSSNDTNVIVLDFGSATTDLSIIDDGALVFSQSISIGSDVLTKSIVQKFGLDYKKAESFKIKYGITPGVLEGKLAEVLSPVIESTLKEVDRAIEYYKNKTMLVPSKKILLNGDAAHLPGLKDYIEQSLNVKAEFADPFRNIEVDEATLRSIGFAKSAYSVAVGLALKDE